MEFKRERMLTIYINREVYKKRKRAILKVGKNILMITISCSLGMVIGKLLCLIY
ncbi:MAG: hypothetical protein RSD47_00795 [Romboutsia sp.]